MKKTIKFLMVTAILFSCTSSVFAKNYAERIMEQKYRKALTMGCEHIEEKSPATAAILGLLPGGGSFYTGAMGLGVADVVLWPFGSTLWDSPLAWNRAKKINMEETIFNCELQKKIKIKL